MVEVAAPVAPSLEAVQTPEPELPKVAVEKIITHTVEHAVTKGETLSSVFKQTGLSASLLHNIIHSSKEAKALTRIVPGEKLLIELDDANNLVGLTLVHDKVHSLHINPTSDGFKTHNKERDVEVRTSHVYGTIDDSLYASALKAGLSDAMILELAEIFGWDIDFALEIRRGDRFTVIFQEEFLDDDKYRDGHILAAEFVNQGRSYRTVRYTDDNGHTDYYTPEGLSMRKAFLRAPVDFRRISSHFARERYHPVLGKKRPHKGVDYAAATGTPVKASGDGKIISREKKGGYGNTVIIEHSHNYTTLYAHLSKFSTKAKLGQKVRQGQVIGYVGQSGLATGPHLHYEFRIDGEHRNPLTVKLPSADPIAKKYLKDFKNTTQPLLAQLDSLDRVIVADAR